MTETLTIDDLASSSLPEGERVFLQDDQLIHTQIMPASHRVNAVVFRFHGSIQRDRRPLPAYQPNIREMRQMAHQITICDPTMMSREGFSASWYAGHENLDVQGLLNRFCVGAAKALNADRVIYIGSSAGGFASLYLSRHHAGSVALVTVPQTNLQNHFIPQSVRKYQTACWPGLTLDEMGRRTCIDVCDLYREPFPNAVIYLQSAGDQSHNQKQLLPFLDAIWHSDENPNFILHSDFWGRMGHGGAVPPAAYLRWAQAAIEAPKIDQTSLLAAYDRLGTPRFAPASGGRPEKRGFSPEALRRADFLRDLQLGRAPDEIGASQ